MSELLTAHGDVTYAISAFDAGGHLVEVDWADLFDLVLDKLGGSPCDTEADG